MNVTHQRRRRMRQGSLLARIVGIVATMLAIVVMAAPIAAQASIAPRATTHGGNLVEVEPSQTASLDPATAYLTNLTDGPNMSVIYGGLCFLVPRTGGVRLYQATSFVASKGGRVWTLGLAPHMKFSDGTAFNAAAVEYNIQRDTNPNYADANAALASSIKMKVLNATTLQMTLQQPDTYFNAYFCDSFTFVGSPTAEKAEGFPAFGQNPVGAGPFKLQSWVQNSSMSFVKNPYFSSFAKGQPYFNAMTLDFLPTVPQQEAALQTGQAQLAEIAAGIPTFVASTVGQNGIVANVTTYGGAGVWLLDESMAPFNSLVAREAFYYAINRSEAALANGGAGYSAVAAYFPKTSIFYNPKLTFPAQNSAMAQQYFNQYAQQNGGPMKIVLQVPAVAINEANAQFVQSQLAQFQNVQTTINIVTQAVYLNAEKIHSYEASTNVVSIINPTVDLTNYVSTDGENNTTDYSSPVVDKALAALRTATTVAAEKVQVDIIQKQLINDYVYFPNRQASFAQVYNKNTIKGVIGLQDGNVPFYGAISPV